MILTDVDILVAGYQIKSYSNEVSVQLGHESQDATVFGMKTRRMKAGLKTATMSISGLAEAGSSPDKIDDILASVTEGDLVSVWPTLAEDARKGYAMRVAKMDHQPLGGAVGDLWPFSVTFEAAGEILRPVVLHNSGIADGSAETASTNGDSVQLGAVSASQRITGILHILSVSGTNPTLDVKIRSDDNVAGSSPTDRITFPQQTAAGFSVPVPVDGAIADDWWDASWTIGGTDPEFIFVVGLYIGPKP